MPKDIKFNIKLAIDGKDIVLKAKADIKDMSDQLVKAKQNTDGVSASFMKWSQGVMAAQSINGLITSLNSTLKELSGDSLSFGKAMREANTMAGKGAEDFGALKDQVSELAKTIPMTRDELAKGLYMVISNGVPEDNWISFLEQSAKASVGGLADLSQVVTVTSTLIKNYGLRWEDAIAIQDKIQLTAKNGVTSFEQLAAALPRVAGNAAQLGVSIEDLLASFATLTGVSGNTAEVSTQIAAIFTALVKPSSEAVKMAQQMGIEFNAAAIKSAGSFGNFISKLDQDVKKFAAANGMLEQEIYSKLFGSAESLRALIPLTGELSEKFAANANNMADSSGTIESAFSEMSQTGSAAIQILKNMLAPIYDVSASVVSIVSPGLEFVSTLGIIAISGSHLASSLGMLSAKVGLTRIVVLSCSTATKIASTSFLRLRDVAIAVSLQMRGAAVGTTMLTTALKGALPVVGGALAIGSLVAILVELCSTTGEASEELDKFKDIEDEGRRKSAEVQVELDNETKKLKALIVAKKDTATAVSELNTKYGDIFGKHKTAAEWYDTLTKKSKAYAMQLGYEAQMKLLATQIAEKQIALEENNQKRAELWRQGKAQKTVKSGGQVSMDGSVHGGVAKTVDTDAYTNLKNTGRGLVADINTLNGKLKIAETRAHDLAKQVGTAVGGTTKPTASTPKPEPAKGKSTTENEIERLKKLKAAAGEAWKSYEALVEGFKDGGEVQAQSKVPEPPKTPKNLAEYDEAIRFYSERQQMEDADQIMATQEKIDELLKGRNVLQLSIDLPDMMKEAAGIDSLRGEDYMIKIGEIGADALIEKLSEINDLLADSENPVGNKQRQSLKMLQKQYGKYINDLDEANKKKKNLEQTGKAAESINQMGSALAGLGDALELPVLNIAGTLAQAIATMVQGYATATTQAASMGPWAWIAFAATGLAQLTAMITSVKQATAFANGGIVSGPTYALVGEYAGASNNPEVIAPLDKLRTMLQPSDQAKTIRVVGKIKGRDIVLAQEKEYTHKSRS